jgi:PAS domain S-box-containing protein
MKKNDNKSQHELTEELAQLRQQVADLQAERLLWQQLNQESLRESEIKFSTLAETTAAAIFIYQDNRNCYVNLATETITGYSRDELLQMNFWEVIHPDFRDFIRERGQARQRGEAIPARYEVKILSKDGIARWLDFTGGLIEFQGRPAVLGTAFDITERKQVEEERERLLAAEREQRLLAETLREVYLALAAQTNPEAVLDEILRQMQRLVPYNTAHISLVEGDYWRIVRWQGYQEVGSEELVASFQQPLANFPLLEKMTHSRQPILISNTAENPDWVILEKSAWIKSHIGVPICSQKRVWGFIQIDGDALHKFSEADVERLQPLANAAAVVLENTRLYDRVRQELAARRQIETEFVQRNAELLSLQYGAATLASSLDLPFILDTLTREMTNLIGAEGCTILEWDGANDTVKIIARYGLPDSWPEGLLTQGYPLAGYSLTKEVLLKRRAQQLTLSQASQYPIELNYMQEHALKALLRLPMEFQDHIVGVIEIMDDQAERVFTNEEIGIAQILANQAANAVQNAYLYAEVNQRLTEQVALQAATTAISSTLDLNTVLSHIAEQMGRAVEATSAYICSYEPETMTSTVLAEYFGPYASVKEQVSDLGVIYELPRDFSTSFEHLLIGQPEEIHENNLSINNSRLGHMQQFGVKTILNIPLQQRGQIIAFAELWESRHKRQFTPDEIALCQGIAQQAAIALEHAQLYARAQQEINERVKAEAELRQSEARQSALLDAIPDVMFRVTRTGQYLDYQPGSEPDSIWPAEVQLGQNLQEVLPPNIADLTLGYIGQALDSGANQVFEFRWPTPLYFQDYETRLVVSGADEVLGIVRNITKRKQMEEQAMQSERLSALGRLSAALTHEINNPLQSMRTHLDLMLDFDLEPGEDKKFLRIMRQEVERLSQITRRILNLARPWPVSRRKVSVIDLLQEVLLLADRQLKQHQIQLTTEWGSVAWVLATPDQLTQIFLNLIINAIEATPANGQLHIGVYPGSDQTIVSFINSGPIIPPDILPHVFEPFFTTKPEGSGLGLWVSHNLVRQHGGSITVENMGSNQGVAFIVTLPTLPILEVIDGNAYLSAN